MIVLRPATDADLPAMAAVFLAAWRGGYRGVVPDEIIDALDPAEICADLAANPHARSTVVAVANGNGDGDGDGRIVGFARFGDDDTGEGGYLASLYVDPAAARAGLGTRLLEHALDAMPGREITLWVFAANHPARRLYERAGFRPDGAQLTDPRWATPQVRYRRPPLVSSAD